MTKKKMVTLAEGFAEKLNAMRAAKKLTQPDAAKGAKVGFRSYCRWEAGEQIPSGRNLAKLAEFYGTTVTGLFS